MEKPNALAYFRGEHGYNCAQAVLKAFIPVAGLDESCMDRFSQFGGGRAPRPATQHRDGCGAIL